MRGFGTVLETGKRKAEDARREAEQRLRSLVADVRGYDARRAADEVLYNVGEVVHQLERAARVAGNRAFDACERFTEVERRLGDVLEDIDELRKGVANFDKDRLIQGVRTAIRRSVTF
jgi:hypothetical protein